jgi:phosphoglucosamine mutase
VLDGANLRGLRIVVDCANGAAYRLGPELFRSLGCDVVTIGSEPDGRNINAGCGSLHLENYGAGCRRKAAPALLAATRTVRCSFRIRENHERRPILLAPHVFKTAGEAPKNRVVATSMSVGLQRACRRRHCYGSEPMWATAMCWKRC